MVPTLYSFDQARNDAHLLFLKSKSKERCPLAALLIGKERFILVVPF